MAKPSKTTKTLSYRQAASLRLAQLYRCAGVMRASGEFLDAGPWLKVLANILSSAPAGPIGKRRGRNAPDQWELSYSTLLVAAQRCGLDVAADDVEQQVLDTGAWRHRESQRIGRPHYAAMRPDRVGTLLGITEEIRREAEAWNVGTFGGSPKARAEARREKGKVRDERRRREAGAKPHSLSKARQKPWEAEGVSRRTWYRRQAESAPDDDPAGGSTAKLAQKNAQQINDRGTDSRAANIPHTLRVRECPERPASGDVETEKTATTSRGGPEVAANPPSGADADRRQDIEAAIARFRAMKGEPAPPYQMIPGGITARAMALDSRRRRSPCWRCCDAARTCRRRQQRLSSAQPCGPEAGVGLAPRRFEAGRS